MGKWTRDPHGRWVSGEVGKNGRVKVTYPSFRLFGCPRTLSKKWLSSPFLWRAWKASVWKKATKKKGNKLTWAVKKLERAESGCLSLKGRWHWASWRRPKRSIHPASPKIHTRPPSELLRAVFKIEVFNALQNIHLSQNNPSKRNQPQNENENVTWSPNIICPSSIVHVIIDQSTLTAS